MKSWTILEILNWTIDFFKSKQIENPRLNAEYIISSVLDIHRIDLYLRFEEPVSLSNRDKIKNLILRRAKREPLQYILQETNFYGFHLFVNKNVLIPRPETEFLVDKIIKENSNVNSILEIGTGSGAISIALAKEINYQIIDAVDISKSVLEVAQKNADSYQVKINFFISNIFEKVNQKYDLIVSNPPYISSEDYRKLQPEIINYEPEIALLSKDDDIYFYRKILEKAKVHLEDKGKIYFEIGYNQADRVQELAQNNGFNNIEIIKDLNDFDRIIKIEFD